MVKTRIAVAIIQQAQVGSSRFVRTSRSRFRNSDSTDAAYWRSEGGLILETTSSPYDGGVPYWPKVIGALNSIEE